MEASALPASTGLARARIGLGAPLLRLRSDEQLVSLFRAGNEDAFRVIHDRYRARMLAYARQMLSSSSGDAEDAVQEIFVRAYGGLRNSRRELALRAWLYRIAHNRCIDELRKPHAIAVEAIDELGDDGPTGASDPHARLEQRESLRRLIVDVQRLPEQQRSALLMRELGGMPYADLAGALGVSVPAVKSLLVRARVGLAQAGEARDTACARIREDLIVAHDRGVRASGLARRHLRDCSHCRQFRAEVQGTSRSFSLLLPAIGPLAVAAKLIGLGGLSGIGVGGGSSAAAGSGAGAVAGGTASGVAAGSGAASCTGAIASGSAVAGGSALAGGGAAAGTGLLAGAGAVAGAGHVATIIAATVVAAGGAIGIQHEVSSRPHHHAAHRLSATGHRPATPSSSSGATTVAAAPTGAGAGTSTSPASTSPAAAARSSAGSGIEHRPPRGGDVVALTAPGRAGYPATSSTTSTGSSTTPTTVSTLPATTPTTTDPTATDPTSTTPTTTDPTATDPTSTTPTTTDPTATDPTSTTPTTTDPTSTTPVTTPIGASGTPTTPTTFAPTTPSTHVPRIDTRRQKSSGAGTILVAARGSGRDGARVRERAGRIVRRSGRSDSTTSLSHRR